MEVHEVSTANAARVYIYEDLFILLKSSLSFDENRPTGFVAKFQPP